MTVKTPANGIKQKSSDDEEYKSMEEKNESENENGNSREDMIIEEKYWGTFCWLSFNSQQLIPIYIYIYV